MSDPSPLVSAFLQLVQAYPERLFLDGEQQQTYARAAARVTHQAQEFRTHAAGLPVVIRGPNTAAWVCSFLAARTAGCVAIPIAADATAQQYDEMGQLVGPFYLYNTAEEEGHRVNPDAQRRQLPRQVGFCLPTSGSTGLPRLALRSDLSLITEGERYLHTFGFAPTDCILAVLPLCHAFVLGLALGGALVSGACVYLTPRFNPRTTQRILRAGTGSILPLVPAAARVVCQAFQDGGVAPQGVRHIIIGAGPVSPDLERDVIERLGRRPARNYGSSETGATLGTAGQVVPDEVTGLALPGVEAVIMGEEQPGALFTRMQAPFLGYLSSDTIDTSRVSPDGWYSTGDFAIQPAQAAQPAQPAQAAQAGKDTNAADGWITITGRIGQGLRRGGRFIQPGEVERVLKSHPDVADVVIIGGRDAHGEDVVEAHLEARLGHRLSVEALRQHAKQALEPYKLPTVWQFYEALPRTSGGKPDRSRLSRPREE